MTRLLILHIHGIGPQMQRNLAHFLHAIRAACGRPIAVPEFAAAGPGTTLAARPDNLTPPRSAHAVMPALAWDDLFGAAKRAWGERLYPQELQLHLRLQRQQLLPWGDFLALLRLFEMQEGSDAFIYAASEEHRQLVFERLFDVLEHPACLGPRADWPDQLPVVLSGHSLGSVIAYDLLRYSSANAGGSAESVARELRLLRAAAQAGGLPPVEAERTARRSAFLERAQDILQRLRPVGLYTYGSPVALFLFRNVRLWQGRERFGAWDDVCPAEFQGGTASSRTPGLRWQWRNYWHWMDFVAHRLEPLLNEGYPGQFVTDVACRYFSGSPITAHTGYMRQGVIAREVAAQIVHCVDVLGNASSTGGFR